MRSLRVQREIESVQSKYPGSYPFEETSGSLILVVPDFPIPPGFTTRSTRIAIRLPSLYPTEKLDLFWVDPALQRSDGGQLSNVMGTGIQMADLTWMQISWHDNAPHDPNRVSLLGYLQGIRVWFASQVGAA
jgi:hypothetical protein